MQKKSKIILIVLLACILIGILSFVVYNKATENDRLLEQDKNNILYGLQTYRNSIGYRICSFRIDSDKQNPELISFLSDEAIKMCEKNETSLLGSFLEALEDEHIMSPLIYDSVSNSLKNSNLSLQDYLHFYYEFENLNYYKPISLNKNSGIISRYIQENGTQDVSTTPGTGYYGNKENESTYNRVGIEGSPLYDATTTYYKGDFKHLRKYGVHLNSYYQEANYSSEDWYFRDKFITFSPYDGDCIYSGDYLFCFDNNGILKDYCKIK